MIASNYGFLVLAFDQSTPLGIFSTNDIFPKKESRVGTSTDYKERRFYENITTIFHASQVLAFI